jgi:hypothetical protein
MKLAYVVVVGELAFAVGVVFVMAWRSRDLVATLALGAALFSLILVVMVAIREQA